jgi:hypothetical protein
MLTETLLKIPFSLIGRCFFVPTFHWLKEKCARINFTGGFGYEFAESQVAACIIYTSVKIAVLGSSQRVTGRIFKISW